MSEQKPTLENLLWLREWMTFLSQPGPKAEFNGVPQPYPAEGQETAQRSLAQVNELFTKFYPDYPKPE